MKLTDWIQTPKSITLIASDGTTQVLLRDQENFDRVKELLQSDRLEEIVPIVWKGLDVAQKTEGRISLQHGSLVMDGEAMPKPIAEKILELTASGLDTSPLERFWENLKQNPTDSAKQDLYTFLTANRTPFTEDGCFIAYKKVNGNFWDNYTGNTHLNTPGSVIEMDRTRVDPNRHNTCSAGLHVADYEYASNFSGSKLLEVKVNPRDVVAVPPDYSARKMRVCKYLVLRETTEKYPELIFAPLKNTVEELEKKGVTVQDIVEPETTHWILTCDKEGRLRIPGKAIRETLRIGAGKKVGVVVMDGSLLLRRALKKDKITYVIQKDNSVRVQAVVLREGLGEDVKSVTVRKSDKSLILE